jgi:hypothetical protein
LATEFRSEQIPRNSLGADSVIPRKKSAHFDGIPNSVEEPIPKLETERNGIPQKIVFRNSQKNYLSVAQKSSFLAVFLKFVASRVLLSGALLPGDLFPARITLKYKSSPGKILATYYKVFLFSSMFLGTEFRVVFSSAEWFGTKFREFCFNFVPRYGITSIFLFQGMGSERNSEIFAFRGTGGIPSE